MAIVPLCAQLRSGLDAACAPLKRRFYQQAVLVQKTDIESYQIVRTDYDTPGAPCQYHALVTLKPGATGYLFIGPETGSSYFGSFDKSMSDLGIVQYNHNASILMTGVSEEQSCVLEALDKTAVVAFYQFTDGTVMVYGLENGLSTSDYTYDPQGGGGGAAIVLSSGDGRAENTLPLVYRSAIPGNETADFDSLFANTSS